MQSARLFSELDDDLALGREVAEAVDDYPSGVPRARRNRFVHVAPRYLRRRFKQRLYLQSLLKGHMTQGGIKAGEC